MVVIVDLDDEALAELSNVKPRHGLGGREQHPAEDIARPNPNYNNGFSAALSCYP
jgi:hypothetical protein